ncbi:MAG: hypothetical protein HY859_00115 [Caulobacterales bacterium]|nr:hypothetical protein [Caulobacterales bacterium]
MPRLLSAEDFAACFAEPMRDVMGERDACVDIWPYVDALDLDELGLPGLNDVHYVYRDARGWFDQVLVGTKRFNALLVIVVDRRSATITGHRVLDLNEKYGNSGGHLRSV